MACKEVGLGDMEGFEDFFTQWSSESSDAEESDHTGDSHDEDAEEDGSPTYDITSDVGLNVIETASSQKTGKNTPKRNTPKKKDS